MEVFPQEALPIAYYRQAQSTFTVLMSVMGKSLGVFDKTLA
jgi:hypothetical protein